MSIFLSIHTCISSRAEQCTVWPIIQHYHCPRQTHHGQLCTISVPTRWASYSAFGLQHTTHNTHTHSASITSQVIQFQFPQWVRRKTLSISGSATPQFLVASTGPFRPPAAAGCRKQKCKCVEFLGVTVFSVRPERSIRPIGHVWLGQNSVSLP